MQRVSTAAVLSLALALVSCFSSRPMHEGPDLAVVPAGYVYSANVDAARHVFRDREVVRQRGYFTHEDEDDPKATHGSIVITEYEGGCTAEQAEAAHAFMMNAARSYEYGEIEPITADRASGWGWTETYRLAAETGSHEYIAVFPCGQTTYTVEVYSSDPALHDPARLREIATSFRVTGS